VIALLVCAVGTAAPEYITREQVDLLEINHMYNEKAEPLWDQLIGWDLTDDGFRVRWFIVLKDKYARPHRVRGQWSMTVSHPGFETTTIRAHVFRETWMQDDPETHDRHWRPRADRPGWLHDH
jgi:hypothetical protein